MMMIDRFKFEILNYEEVRKKGKKGKLLDALKIKRS